MVITGAGNDLRLLRRAGIQDAEFFIALTDSDEFNMVACGLASREFSVPFKIARVRNQQYHARSHLFDGSMLDIDYIVNPEIEAGRAIVQTVEHGATSEVVTLADTDIEMRVLPIMGDSAFCDRTIAQARVGVAAGVPGVRAAARRTILPAARRHAGPRGGRAVPQRVRGGAGPALRPRRPAEAADAPGHPGRRRARRQLRRRVPGGQPRTPAPAAAVARLRAQAAAEDHRERHGPKQGPGGPLSGRDRDQQRHLR